MANKVIIDGEVCFGSTDSAENIICKDIDGNQSNVQIELDGISNKISNEVEKLSVELLNKINVISVKYNNLIDLFTSFTESYKNKWLFELAATCSNTIESFNTKIPSRMVYIHDSATVRNMTIADSYTAKATTWVRVDEDIDLTCTLETDDAGALFVNKTLIANLATCTPTSVTLPLKAGWNEVIVMYTEGSGGDGWIFTPRLSENSSIVEMNAICHLI